MPTQSGKFLVGVTAAWLQEDDERTRYDGRPLLFVEQSMGEWLMTHGGLVPMMIPGVGTGSKAEFRPRDFAARIDGLVVQGGVDISPELYGEQPLRPEWAGDPIRDEYELAIAKACLAEEIPILAICRGHQLLNVALGGALYQDVKTQIDGALTHRDADRYHRNTHAVSLESGGGLRDMYGVERGLINSVHHQAIRTLGDGLAVEARSPHDGVVEAVRLKGHSYALGLQWHPEFQESSQSELMSTTPILDDFFEAMCRRWDVGAAM